MKRSLAVLTVAGAMTAAMALAQTAPARPGAEHGMRGRIHQQLMQQLNLTSAQKQQAKTIRMASREKAQPIVQQLRGDRQSLAAAVKAGDTAKIDQLSANVGTLRGKMVAIRAEGMSKFYALLTPDQKAKVDQFRHEEHQVVGTRGE